MTASIINGKEIAETIQNIVKVKIERRKERQQRVPGLAVILVGDDPASQIYVNKKHDSCERLGIFSQVFHLPAAIEEIELLKLVDTLNHDPKIDGILVQLPLPKHITPSAILERIKPDKDIDGFHPYNLGRLAIRMPLLRPCTPFGIITLLEQIKVKLKGINAVIVGASNIVGRPMALELLAVGASVDVCHRFTRDLEQHVRRAELLIVAIGKPGIIKTEWLKPGVIVIDVGMNRAADGSLCGDIDFASAKTVASYITPVPGGVGPMTVAMLMYNTLFAAEYFHHVNA